MPSEASRAEAHLFLCDYIPFPPGSTQVTRGSESGSEGLLNADGKFRGILHPLPHQERPIRAVGEDAFCSSTLHGASVPAETHRGGPQSPHARAPMLRHGGHSFFRPLQFFFKGQPGSNSPETLP